MRRFKYIIVDDDDIDRLATSFYLKNYQFLEHTASFSSSVDALKYIESNDVNILFLDIDMPEINGIEFLKRVGDKVMCAIFITSHSEFALEGFELSAFDYIVKPLAQERFDRCIKRLQEYLELKMKAELFEYSFKNESIIVKEGYNYVTIQPYEVVYLEALKDYTKIILLNKRNVVVHGNLRTMLSSDNFRDFIRIHKSYAIQKKYIQMIKANEIVLINNITIPIGQNYKKNLLENLT